jgi:trigger factor
LNIQTEHLEDHTARLMVEIEPDRLEKAKRAAAKSLAKRVAIPGFRKGKAPYNVLVQYVGEANILQDALEDLSQEIYRESLDQSQLEPYGPGAWNDFKLEPSPTFIYTIPLQPTTSLGEYRSVRVDYETPIVVDDEMLNSAMKRLQQQEALAEESSQPVAVGNRITVDIHSHFVDGPSNPDAVEQDETETSAETDTAADPDHDHDDDHDHDHAHDHDDTIPYKGDEFVHQHDAALILDPEDEPILPGFIAAMQGAAVGEERRFELMIPEDDDDYEDIRGRRVEFHVTVKKIEVITVPPLNDDLAARITAQEETPLSLLELRMRMRENLQKEINRRAEATYADQALAKIVEGATIAFPEAMIDDQVEDMVKDFESRLRGNGLNLDTYLRVMGMTRESLEAEYRPIAIGTIKQMLTLRQLIVSEKIEVADSAVVARMDEMLKEFGDQAESLRPVLDTPAMRASITNDLLQQNVMQRVVQIARGDELPALESLAATDTASDTPAAIISAQSEDSE